MRQPRWDFTTRALMFAVVLIAFNLAGLRATLSCYPLPRKPPPIVFGKNKGIYIHYSGYRNDGRFEEWFADPATGATSPHKVWPSPHPTLLRIWSPALSTLALSLLAIALAVVLASGRVPRPRMTPRRLAIAMPAAILATWLILPLAEIVANPRGDYHTHSDNRTVHREPFWPRYARRLMGRPWPDDYICPDYPARAGPPPRVEEAPRIRVRARFATPNNSTHQGKRRGSPDGFGGLGGMAPFSDISRLTPAPAPRGPKRGTETGTQLVLSTTRNRARQTPWPRRPSGRVGFSLPQLVKNGRLKPTLLRIASGS